MLTDKGSKHKLNQCTEILWKQYLKGIMPVIPDIKIKSPGEGELMGNRDPVRYARLLTNVGAPMLSVVTETEHYGGSGRLLHDIAETVSVPILRKDFITKKEQLKESVNLGASGVLLMASIMETSRLIELFNEAVSLGLEPLVETHSRQEIEAVSELPLTFFGINNRNILEWETDSGNITTTELLAEFTSSECFVLSESSITSPEEVMRVASSGANGVLIGTAILKAENPVEMYRRLCIPVSS